MFVVNLENENFDDTFGARSPAQYLIRTLLPQGQLLDNYYGIAHNSLPNYIAQISGQGPNPQTQADCPVFTDFRRVTTTADGQAVGTGCVFPADVPTVADQLTARRFTWKGYMEDIGNSPTEPKTCRHPAIGAADDTQQAHADEHAYRRRHNPFVYFHSIIDSPVCAQRVVGLDHATDLRSASTTPNLAYITPNLCDDGHDEPCVDGRPGGLVSADAWLQVWIPKILASPAFRHDGMLVVTFDEAELDGASADSSSCCGEGPGPNTPLPGITGLGGGRVGALVVSRWTRPGLVNATAYNHYGLLRSIEDLFALDHLGYAGSPSVPGFGSDVFDRDLNLPGGVAKPHNPDTVSRLETAARARAEGLGGRGVVAASNRTSLRSLATAALELAALSGAAIAQPLLDEFGRAPDVFIRAGVSRWDIVLFAFVIAVVPVAILLGVEVIVAAFAGERVRHFAHLALVAALGLLLALRALRSVFGWQGALLLVVALAVAAGVAVRPQPVAGDPRMAAVGGAVAGHRHRAVPRVLTGRGSRPRRNGAGIGIGDGEVGAVGRGAAARRNSPRCRCSTRTAESTGVDSPTSPASRANPRGSGTRRASARTRSSPCRR